MSSSPLMLRSALSSPKEGFALEDATGLSLNGDVDVHSIFVVSLPTSHPSFASQKLLEKSSRLKAPPLPDGPVELFIGIHSAGNHFAERMAVWKSWMQHRLIKSSNVVARFFVALHPRREVNVELMKEAEFFGDIVLVPYMNTYDLVVLKTVAISDYGEWPEEDYPPYANGRGGGVARKVLCSTLCIKTTHFFMLFWVSNFSWEGLCLDP